MTSKKQPGKKVLDISRPKRRGEVPSAPQIVLPKRSIIVPVSEPEIPDAEPINAKQVAGSVQPPEHDETPAPSKEKPEETPASPEATPESKAQADKTPEESTESVETEETTKETGETDNDPKSKSNAHVRKAVEDAKREQEIQGYIENREFFVPINAVARKRSLRVSVFLALLELLLGLILLNLMLDAGIIQLLDKLPHTNFFELNNP